MPRFHVDAESFIDRPLDEVRAFFADPNSLVLWDRSVSKVVVASPNPSAVGGKFATIGPFRRGGEGKRSEHRVIAVESDKTKIELVNAPMFTSAIWSMSLKAHGDGTNVRCEMDMSTDVLRAPIGLLLKLNEKAITTDLQFLKRAIEHGEVATR
jgi:hypothetical protein